MDDELFERFPDMEPVDEQPSLSSVNGIGLAMYGQRDFDELTGTYVKTHWFALLFIPIVAVGAYRVANASSGGWFFLGKVPVSRAARAWTVFLFACLLSLGGYL